MKRKECEGSGYKVKERKKEVEGKKGEENVREHKKRQKTIRRKRKNCYRHFSAHAVDCALQQLLPLK
jgi:hypothetical protein